MTNVDSSLTVSRSGFVANEATAGVSGEASGGAIDASSLFGEISPLTRVAEITKPMFVVTGGNDPRVPASEADQIVKAIRDRGGVAWHLLGKNEGHGFAKKENVDYQFWASLMFWKQNLLN